MESPPGEHTSMAEQSKINQKSGSQFTTTPSNTVQNPFPKLPPRKYPPQTNRKITQSNVDIHNSPYFKIRSLVQELRPHFVEVLQTPDFQNCNGAHEIRMQMKLMMDLYKQMTMEAPPMGNFKNVSEHQPLSGASVQGKETRVARRGRKPSKQPKLHLPEQVPTFEKPLQSPQFSYIDSQPKGSYIVGGSSLGRNFITFRGSKPVYYGVTKEMHRHSLRQKKVNP